MLANVCESRLTIHWIATTLYGAQLLLLLLLLLMMMMMKRPLSPDST